MLYARAGLASFLAKTFLSSTGKPTEPIKKLHSTHRCKYPFIPHDERDSFNYPTSILCTKRGFVFVLEKWQILILNEDLECYQPPMKGQYSGLVEESDGSVSTLRVRSDIFHLKPPLFVSV